MSLRSTLPSASVVSDFVAGIVVTTAPATGAVDLSVTLTYKLPVGPWPPPQAAIATIEQTQIDEDIDEIDMLRRIPARALMMAAMVLPLVARVQAADEAPIWWFVDATATAGLTSSHGYAALPITDAQKVAGGVAAGDFDGDGLTDLYVVGGTAGANRLFRNRGDGTFADVAGAAGVALAGVSGSGPLFFDYDGDGRLDLFVGAVEGDAPVLFHNQGDGTFADVTAASGLGFPFDTVSATAGDYDGDGWLDLFLSHWGAAAGGCHLWHNDAGAGFSCADADAGLDGLVRGLRDWTFTANFADIDGDGRVDLLVTEDYGQSTVWINQGGGRFANATGAVITDENGMGSAVGDYDGDGDLDWFVSSIRDADGTTEGNWGTTGNRLYRNRGDGTFEDATDEAGVRDGDWGWAASFADFNNDGLPDLVHVNGWPQGSPQFRGTRARLFIAGPGGHFVDRAEALGLDERIGGRGVVCFDYDGDGDLDLFVFNNSGPHHLWRNDGGRAGGHFLDVTVAGAPPNAHAVGARVTVTAGGRSQLQEVRDGSNYVSQNPFTLHFGLGAATRADRVDVAWPDGRHSSRGGVAADQAVIVGPGAGLVVSGGGCS
jgi:hypothetical protein